MKRIQEFIRIVIGIVFLTAAISTEAIEIVCPETINVTQKNEASQNGDWVSSDIASSNMRHFYAVSFSNGSPTERVFLSPEKTIVTKNKKSDMYTFTDDIKRPVWLICQYLETSVTMARPLTEPHHHCEVIYDPLTSFASVKRVDCH